MKRRFYVIAIITAFLMSGSYVAKAQTKPSADLPKYEVGVDFSTLTITYGPTLPGLGGRFTYNLNKHVALEAAGYFFPGKCQFCGGPTTGHITEGLFGVKAGHRFKKWGIFGKARPGFMIQSKGAYDFVPTSGGNPYPFGFVFRRQTNFALDLGGVLEFYPSKRIVLRFDGGDTIIRHPQRTINSPIQDPNTGAITLAPFTIPSYTQHSLQFTGGVGFRF
jgi:hypothetical protein